MIMLCVATVSDRLFVAGDRGGTVHVLELVEPRVAPELKQLGGAYPAGAVGAGSAHTLAALMHNQRVMGKKTIICASSAGRAGVG